MFLTGCATRPQVKSSGAFDGQALAAEISVSGPITNDSESQNVSQKVIRKTAMVAQAGYLFVGLPRFGLGTIGPPDRCTLNRRTAQTPGNRLWPAVLVDQRFALFRVVFRCLAACTRPADGR